MHAGKKVFAGFLALCLTALAQAPVQAAEEEYTYTIRFYAGAQGTIGGASVQEYREVPFGERISFSQNRVELKDNSKYYVRGIRASGRDNDTAQSAASFLVTEDADYVVSYGILSDAVMYTVEYVDAAGNALAPSETYYGNVGDRPVLAFVYIEGYQPQAYNLTGTLDRDASRNVFRFVYSRVTAASGQETPGGTGGGAQGTTGTGGGAQGTAGTGGDAQGTAGAGDTAPGAEEGNQENGGQPQDGEEIPEENVPLTQPDEIQDIHDEEIPLVEGGPMVAPAKPNGFAHFIGKLPIGAKIAIGIAAVAAVWAGWFFLIRRKKEKR